MIYKSIWCFGLFLFVFCNLLNAKNIDLNKVEKEVIRNNRTGNQKISQKKISDYLLAGNLTKEEEANLLFLMATTYRSVNDHMMCMDYLDKSYAIAKGFPKGDLLRMKLDYEYAFVYFDYNQYDKSKMMMDHIAAQKYKNSHPEDDSYILMQEGLLFLKEKKVDLAEEKYNKALDIMKAANTCNVPVVLGKMIELYGVKGDVGKAEGFYKESMGIADGCKILKYKIYCTFEMEKAYKNNGQVRKAYTMGLLLDTLKSKDNLEDKVAEMHLIDKSYVEKERLKHEESDLLGVIVILVIVVVISVLGLLVFYRSSKILRKDNRQMEIELEQVNEELNNYSQNSNGFDEKSSNHMIFDFDLDELTDRQKELLVLMAEGLSNREIAEKLFITESTVKYHIKNIYSLLDIKDRKDLFKKIRNS